MNVFEKYNELKKKSPLAIVFMKVGDFYETYDVDAQTCHDILGLSLTKRTGTMHLLTGFPKHALEGYVKKLHDAGRATVACNEDFSNSNNNNKNQKTEKTMEKINFRTIMIGVRYMYNKEMESLVEVRPLREVFNLNTGKATQEWRVADTDKVMTTHYTPATETEPEMFDGEMYHTLEDFEHGCKMSIDDVFCTKRDEAHICCCLLKCGYRYIYTDDNGAYTWIHEKGQAQKWYFREHIDTVYWEYSEHGQITVTSDYDGGEMPDSYRSPEDVYKYNDYRFVDADGHEEVREGVYNRLKLEPDQEKMVEKLQGVLDECRAAGIRVYFSTTHYELMAVNERKVERIDYDPEYDEETEQTFEFNDHRVSHVFSGVYSLNSEDSDIRFVIKK